MLTANAPPLLIIGGPGAGRAKPEAPAIDAAGGLNGIGGIGVAASNRGASHDATECGSLKALGCWGHGPGPPGGQFRREPRRVQFLRHAAAPS